MRLFLLCCLFVLNTLSLYGTNTNAIRYRILQATAREAGLTNYTITDSTEHNQMMIKEGRPQHVLNFYWLRTGGPSTIAVTIMEHKSPSQALHRIKHGWRLQDWMRIKSFQGNPAYLVDRSQLIIPPDEDRDTQFSFIFWQEGFYSFSVEGRTSLSRLRTIANILYKQTHEFNLFKQLTILPADIQEVQIKAKLRHYHTWESTEWVPKTVNALKLDLSAADSYLNKPLEGVELTLADPITGKVYSEGMTNTEGLHTFNIRLDREGKKISRTKAIEMKYKEHTIHVNWSVPYKGYKQREALFKYEVPEFFNAITIRGQITDENGNPISFLPVTISEGGSEVNTKTMKYGNFKVTLPLQSKGPDNRIRDWGEGAFKASRKMMVIPKDEKKPIAIKGGLLSDYWQHQADTEWVVNGGDQPITLEQKKRALKEFWKKRNEAYAKALDRYGPKSTRILFNKLDQIRNVYEQKKGYKPPKNAIKEATRAFGNLVWALEKAVSSLVPGYKLAAESYGKSEKYIQTTKDVKGALEGKEEDLKKTMETVLKGFKDYVENKAKESSS